MWGKHWSCADTDAHLDPALMGELGPVRRRAFGRHRAACSRCQTVIAEAVTTVGLLRSWPLEGPSEGFAARVVAARPAPQPAANVSWIRYAQATLVWAVCLSVALISIAGMFWPGLWDAPVQHAGAALAQLTQALGAFGIVATTFIGLFSLAAWAGILLGVTTFYSAAFVGLRRFLLRRPI